MRIAVTCAGRKFHKVRGALELQYSIGGQCGIQSVATCKALGYIAVY